MMFGSQIQESKIPDSRFKIQDSRFKIQDSRFQIPDSRSDRFLDMQDSLLDIQDSISAKSILSTLFSRVLEFGILNFEFFQYSFAAFQFLN
jgi:hypothetical protein